jgi:hypothetical protein
MKNLVRQLNIPERSALSGDQYIKFLQECHDLFSRHCIYFSPDEDMNCLELAHLLPEVPETTLAIYLGINDAVCNKGLIAPILPQHGHNNVFVFDNEIYGGGHDVPTSTIDARGKLSEFEPPNQTWDKHWTYVMIADPKRTIQSLWKERGYIDTIPAKFEDFTMLSNFNETKVCIFVSAKCFEHPVNKSRTYLDKARKVGDKMAGEFKIPDAIRDEFNGLVPVILNRGEKLYIATTDFSPCPHGWSNLHANNSEWAVVNENSAVPLELAIAKPPVGSKYAANLVPPKGSADMTTDWWYRGEKTMRKPLLEGLFKG